VVYAGHTYSGYGDLLRQPATTGRTGTGTFPGCDDGNGAPVKEKVEVQELADIPLRRAILVNGQFYYRAGSSLPEAARPWFSAPHCNTGGDFELTGSWLGVTGGPEPAADGDIRLPYRLAVRVIDGPKEYVGATVHIRATRKTDPALGPHDVRRVLGNGGRLTAGVHCDGRTFIADGLAAADGQVRSYDRADPCLYCAKDSFQSP
jgi:hypothetical protein